MLILISIMLILLGLILMEDPKVRDYNRDLRMYKKVIRGKYMFKYNKEDILDIIKYIVSNLLIVIGILALIYLMFKYDLVGGIW